ncbi:MAG TPA: glycosyltransferase family 4 protein [Edaphobacter sp.]|nr:glycosyltransferase family 4 protein [Edaphobacter sp.]
MITILNPATLKAESTESNNRPHVLLVVDEFPRSLGGGERVALKIASLLPDYGYRVSILTFSIDPKSLAFDLSSCPIYQLPLKSAYNLDAFAAAIELRRFLRNQKIDIVQTFFESSDLWAGLVARATAGVKLIWSRRDMGILRGRKHHLAYRLLSRLPHAVFAVSEQVRQYCIEKDGIPPTRIQTIYNGLDLANWEFVSKPHHEPRKFLITTTGNIRHIKGHDIFIKAAAIVRQRFPGASFSIAGRILDHAYFAELQALIHDLGLTDHFHFMGELMHLGEHLNTADVFVLPSRSEGFSSAIVEAMAATLPVVATDVGGNPEAVKDGVNGYVVPPEDFEALAQAIIRLLEDPAKAKKMGEAGKLIVSEKFTTEMMMTQTVGTYKKLLNGKSRRGTS